MSDHIPDAKATTIPVLRYLIALAEHRHFGRAAAACGVAQPTLSAQLSAWERRMRIQAFERGPHGVRVTPAGERVVAAARTALAALCAVEDAAGAAKPPFYGPVRLGIIPTVAPDALPWIASALEHAHPDLELPVREATTAELTDLLSAGGIDIALVALLPGMHGQALYIEPFLAALPRGHRLAGRREIDAAALAGERLLLLDEGHCLRGQALDLCGHGAASLGADYRSTSLATLRRLVAAGLGVTVLPALSVEDDDRSIVCRPLAGSPSRTIGLLWREQDPRADAFRLIAATIRKAAPRASVRLA
jgi:LysR family transcriptional regulator, hydrogen peroxide-inducible genes activator